MDYSERFQYAVRLIDSGRAEEALQEFRALRDSTADPTEKTGLLVNEVNCLDRLGRTKEARERLREAAQLLPETSEFRPHIDVAEAGLCISEGKAKEAFRKLNQILAENAKLLRTPNHEPLYKEIQIRRGILLVELERSREARPILEEALSFGLEKGQVLYHLGVCYYDVREFQSAKQKFAEALDVGINDCRAIRAHYYLGLIYGAEGAFARAKRELELCEPQASEADIPKKYVYQNIATACQQLGLEDEAERYTRLAKKG